MEAAYRICNKVKETDMKKTLCLLLVLFSVEGLWGCQKDGSNVTEMTTPEYVLGEIIDIISSDEMILKISDSGMSEGWGDAVSVICNNTVDFCIGDRIRVEFSKYEPPLDDTQLAKIFAEKASSFETAAKPIIYFYPEIPTVCSAKVLLDGSLTCTYPICGDSGWENFTAYPDGTLLFPDGKEYYALYWEGEQNTVWDFSEGFCVRGEDTAAFLEWALSVQGLSPREANEFIVYWLPLMEDNKYNVISFQTTAYTDGAALNISPAPDSILRVFMAYYPSDVCVDIEPQTFEGAERNGFTVVEWGGSLSSQP